MALPLEAQLNIQCRHDKAVLKYLGIDKNIRKEIKHRGDQSHDFMFSLALRILQLGGDTNYTVGAVVDVTTLGTLFDKHIELHTGLMTVYLSATKTCVTVSDETTAEKLRHIEERHESAVCWFEQQKGLIEMVGDEGTYLAEKMST